MGITDLNNLGQYFTPANVAEYMANEIISAKPTLRNVLDPCIGENIFFSFLDNNKIDLQGVEIDDALINDETKTFFNKSNRNLIIGDFIDQKFDRQFDAVIMNPPYTRQEMISLETKKKLQTIKNIAGIEMSAKANLYVYFLLKGLFLLKTNGLLVAITYDSWLYSSFGTNLKKYLVEKHNLKQIIHFKNSAFDGVDVGATILVIEKNGITNFTKYSKYKSAQSFSLFTKKSMQQSLTPNDLLNFNDYTFNKKVIQFPSSHFVTIGTLTDKLPWRGTSSLANKHFLYKENNEEFTPILKKTPQDAYSISLKDADYAFAVSPDNNKPETLERLEQIKKELLETGSESQKQKIKNNLYWYKFPLKPGGEILFNYYFRKNLRFVLNEDNVATMGNYYNIKCSSRTYETFALLNSSLTRYAVNRYSKSQGKGLRKIQLYKFNQIPIFSLKQFTDNQLEILKKFGKLLANNENVINDIDDFILKRYCQLLGLKYSQTKSIIDMEQGP